MLDFDLMELSSWEYIKNSCKPVVIYGMGNGADAVLNELYRLQIPVLGVTASDDFVRGQQFRGFTVKKLSEFQGDFILAVAFGTCIPEVINHIVSLNEKYDLIVPVVPVYGTEIFNRDFVLDNADKINKAYSLFTEKSKEIFAGCIRFMFGGRLNDLLSVTTEKNEIFNSFLNLGGNEAYLDLGAYKGDTVEEFLKYSGGSYNKIIAVEPDIKNCNKMINNLSNLQNFTAVNKAISDKCGTVLFANNAGRNSSISNKGKAVESVTIDSLCLADGVSYIKADVEGEEISAIKGGQETLKKYKPKLNIALYHKSSDIFEIPLLINSINPDYIFEIRRHPYIPCWDMNLYAK